MSEKVRAAVMKNAIRMEEILRLNDHKGGWEKCPFDYLATKLFEEIGEFIAEMIILARDNLSLNAPYVWKEVIGERINEVLAGAKTHGIEREGVDIQNIIMMIIDNLEREAAKPPVGLSAILGDK